MRKLLSAIAIVTLIAFVGCKESGVPQEDHDKVKKELEDANVTIDDLELLLDEALASFDECKELLDKNKIVYTGPKPTKKEEEKPKEEEKETGEKERGNDADPKDRIDGSKSPEDQKKRN